MKKVTQTPLLHPFFIACLVILLLNDFALKPLLHNWLTGKLSDIAGVAAFAIFFTAVFPRKKEWVFAGTTLLFVWFKSPLSAPFITFCNNYLHLPIHRVVDYTDYVALPVLFFAWKLKPVEAFTWYKKIAMYMAGGVSVFAFCATEAPRYLQYNENVMWMNGHYKTIFTEEDVLRKLDSLHLDYAKDSFEIAKVYLLHGSFFYKQKDTLTGIEKSIALPTSINSNLYNRYSVIPFIAIKNFVYEGDTIPEIRIRVEETGKTNKNFINLWEAQLSETGYRDYIARPGFDRRKFERHIHEGLIQKLQ